jgi:TusE/DsrC/DsvC family sulfur relay protein
MMNELIAVVDNETQESATESAPESAPPMETPVDVNERGFMVDLSRWTPGVALYLARRQGLDNWPYEFTARHWRVIEYTRAYYHATGNAPSLRFTCKALALTKKHFSRLFPGGLMTVRRISGLPGPRRSANRQELSTAQQLLTANWWERLTRPDTQEHSGGKGSRVVAPPRVAHRPATESYLRSSRVAAGVAYSES